MAEGLTVVAPLAVLVALAIDRWLGEPPTRWHPVVWMGNYLGWLGPRIAPQAGASTLPAFRPWLGGAVAWCVGAAAVCGVALALQSAMSEWAWWAQALALGALLKPLLAWRMLRDEVQAVDTALGQGLAAGRARLAWLVSRDVASLDESQVRESAIETLAENLNDSVVAPLFWFAVAGLPGAALYRFANTADAMWGYPGERGGRLWTWAGQWAARADDVLSWVPARLTALLLALRRPTVRLRALPAQARLTPSPNSGWPMACMALALGVRLRKPGGYSLNAQARAPIATDVAQALQLAGFAVGAVGLLAGLLLVWGALA